MLLLVHQKAVQIAGKESLFKLEGVMQIAFILRQVGENADDIGGRKCDKLIIDYIILNAFEKTGLILHDLAIFDHFNNRFNALI